ncbi:MAG: thioredoxin family protein, partial [Holosporaceae bacterium]|jgi:suppressor for copper-sensitivity B|nr:thioredoxin family protein [Holosporaceae bacterium]
VLPVLLLKLKSVLSPDRKTALAGAIAGNYASFLSIALLLSLLKMGGTPVGWGFHFQNFVFLKIAAVVLFLLVLQAFGIISPSPSIRPKNVARSVFAENFLSSIIACFLAIPCTAPFLGTASVFALRESPIEMFLIFLAIATGFSLPLLGIAFLRFHLPKNFQKYSGAAQKLVSCGVLLAFGWVLWLLANHLANSIIMLYILTFLLCFWLFKVRRSALAGTFAAALLLVPENWDQDRWKNTTIHYVYQSTADVAGKISAALAKNMPVILDISADWCLTCSYNKLRLLNDTAVQEMLVKNDVLHIEIDLTKRSDEWTAFISQHGRSGIPFMMVYGPRFPNGRLLPEIPSVDQLLDAIKSAKTN